VESHHKVKKNTENLYFR